jgi:hypothetical protein
MLNFLVGQRIVSPSDLHDIGWGIGQRIGCENIRVDGPKGARGTKCIYVEPSGMDILTSVGIGTG